MKRFKVGVWGQFGDGGAIADGQAVRTTIVTEELKHRYGTENVLCVNTNAWYKKKLRFLFQSLGLLVKSDTVAIFPADNGFRVIVPLLTFANLFFKRKLLYVVIGGFLPKLLEKQPKYIKMLHKFDAMFVQTDNIKNDLEKLGLNNIRFLTNLKRITPVSEESVIVDTEENIKVCTFSRITEDKGIIDAIEAIKLANEKLGGDYVSLDVFGIVAKNFQQKFDELLSENKKFVSYSGVCAYDKTVEVLKDYFALLFPTYYHGEGFPGGFIDAFNSALPVIATDWLYNGDLIKHGENGILVPIKSPEAICDAILQLYNDRELRQKLALNSLSKAKNYAPEAVLKNFFEYID